MIGPTTMIFDTFVNGVGQHIQNFIGDVLMINPYGDNTWIMNWRVFYFAWFIAWTPFVGMFIARISKGRTIREFIIGVVIVPTIFTIIISIVTMCSSLRIRQHSRRHGRGIVHSAKTQMYRIRSRSVCSKKN